jgi:hypothetical protein
VHFPERLVVLDQIFRVNNLILKETVQSPRGVLKRLPIRLANGAANWDVIANGKAMPGNG